MDHKGIQRDNLQTSPNPFQARLKYWIVAASIFRYHMDKNAPPLASNRGKPTAKR